MEKTHFFRGYQPGSGRHNAAGVDINRDFPSWNETSKTRADLEAGRAPETVAAMEWILDRPFVLSINFHDGAVVANYPYDDCTCPDYTYSAAPDDETFKLLALSYANNHQWMHR